MQPSPYLPGNPRKPIGWILRSADAVIPYVQMGYTALRKLDVPTTLPVYTGIDLETECTEPPPRSQVFSGMVTDDTFVFMTMGANGARKCMDRILHSFAKFLDKMSKRDGYKLYMHTDLSSALGGADLRTIADKLGIKENIMYTPSNRYGAGIDKKELYQKYASSDCYIGLPGGEGYGYGFCESMLHGLPLIYIDHGGHVDYCKDAGLPVKVKDYIYARNTGIQWALADTDDAAKAMARMVSDKKLRQKLGDRGKEIVHTELDWNITYPKWEETVLEQYYAHKDSKVPGYLKRVF
jgi:glycosyltransferase involved in cell wall biosynthesis